MSSNSVTFLNAVAAPSASVHDHHLSASCANLLADNASSKYTDTSCSAVDTPCLSRRISRCCDHS